MTNLPITGEFQVTCEYLRKGDRWSSGYHRGIDLTCSNRYVYCTCDGTVKSVGWDPDGWGRYVRVDNGQGRIHIFCHLVKDSVKVKIGDKVNRTTVLGTMGTTGNSTGVHLHFQIEDAKRNVYNPTEWLGIPNKVGSYNSWDYVVKEVENMAFKDQKDIPVWAEAAVNEAVKDGLMLGDDTGKFRPNDPVTRAELAVVLARMKQ